MNRCGQAPSVSPFLHKVLFAKMFIHEDVKRAGITMSFGVCRVGFCDLSQRFGMTGAINGNAFGILQ